MIKAGCQLASVLAAFSSSAVQAVTFDCKSPKGYALFQDGKGRWEPDGMSDGILRITFDDETSSDVEVGYGDKPVKSLRTEGAVINPVSDYRLTGFPVIVVRYPESGLIDVYSISGTDNKPTLSWTTVRDGKLSGQTGKVGAYTAKCERK